MKKMSIPIITPLSGALGGEMASGDMLAVINLSRTATVLGWWVSKQQRTAWRLSSGTLKLRLLHLLLTLLLLRYAPASSLNNLPIGFIGPLSLANS